MLEVWRGVPSLPGVEASSLGRVRKKPYTVSMPHGGVRTYVGTPTFGVWCKDEERFIYQYNRKSFKVHFAVCEAFHGQRPFPEAVVMHDDENSANNGEANLKWGTQKQNLNYAGFKLYCAGRTGDNNPRRKGMLEQKENSVLQLVPADCGRL